MNNYINPHKLIITHTQIQEFYTTWSIFVAWSNMDIKLKIANNFIFPRNQYDYPNKMT